MIDERETEMMSVRWKIFHLNVQIQKDVQKELGNCCKCFATLSLTLNLNSVTFFALQNKENIKLCYSESICPPCYTPTEKQISFSSVFGTTTSVR